MSKFLPNQSERESFLFESNYKLAKIFLTFFFLILISRLWYLQIINGEEFRNFSKQNLLKSSDIYAPRGTVYDRDDKVLVENLPAYKAIITPQYAENLEELAKDLSSAIGIEKKKIIEKVRKSKRQNGPFFPVDIKLHLSRDELFKVELIKLDHSGLATEEFIQRYYPFSGEIAHTLGYVREISKAEIPRLRKQYKNKVKFKQKDIIGKYGLEEAFDLQLRGKKGQSFVVVDAKGQKRSPKSINAIGEILKNSPSQPGADIHTTLDLDLQMKASEAFEKFKRVGSLIAMTPKGEILAWVSYPSFDPNIFSKRVTQKVWRKLNNDPDNPLRNKAIQDHYAPGSTFKPIVALAGLQEQAIKLGQKVYAPPSIMYGGRRWHDHTRTGQGKIGVAEAIERSSNVFFYKLGEQLGPDKIAKYATALGLGSRVGLPIRGEVPGHIPTKAWKKKRWGEPWQGGESLNTAIGQGHVLVTNIQLAQAYSAIALGGAVYKPQIIKKMITFDEKTKELNEKMFEPQLLRDLSQDKESDYYVEEKYFNEVQKGLYNVVNGKKGTAKFTRFKKPFSVSGKTGTAQVRRFSADQIYGPCENRPKKDRHNGWFVGYGSYKGEAKITVAVLTEHSCRSSAAVPIAKEVFQAFFKKYHNMRMAKK